MTIEASGAIGPINEVLASGEYPGVTITGAALPSLTGRGGVPVGDGSLWISNRSSPAKQAAAWELVKFLVAPEQIAGFATASGYVPIRKSAAADPAVQEFWAENPDVSRRVRPAAARRAVPRRTARSSAPTKECVTPCATRSWRCSARTSPSTRRWHVPNGVPTRRSRTTTRGSAPDPPPFLRRSSRPDPGESRREVPRTGEDRDAGVGAAADGVGEADPGAVDLAGAGGAAELADELDHLTERRRAERLALREQPAATG